jgi:nucleoside-diphosphate-sugar epimerase
MSRRVLITGGAGFVGRHVTRRFLNLGFETTVVDNFSPGSGSLPVESWMEHLRPKGHEPFELIRDDCRNFFRAKQAKTFDAVVHLAAVVGGRLVIEGDPLQVGLDLSIDAEFFYWLSRLSYRPERIYYFSSSAVYPIQYQRATDHRPLREDMVCFDGGFIGQPDLTYGWAKLTGEFLAKLTNEKHGQHITCFRPFSGYGEDQDFTYPFPSILRRAVAGETPITVWGSGRQMRDFIYIEDCIDGMLKIAERTGDASAVNLSTGIPTSFTELAQLAFRAAQGREVEVTNTSDKPEGVFARYGSVDRQRECGFEARRSLADGVRLCLDYWSRYGIS